MSVETADIDIQAELTLLDVALQALGANGRHVTVGTRAEIDEVLNHHLPVAGVNLQNGILHRSAPEWIDASFIFPFDAFEDSNVVFSTSSLGVPSNLEVLLSDEPTDHTPASEINKLVVFRKVMEDYARKGIAMINRETAYKAAVIQHAVDESAFLSMAGPGESRSKTILAFFYSGANNLVEVLVNKGYSVDEPEKGQPFTIYNSPTHSKEQFEQLSDVLMHVK